VCPQVSAGVGSAVSPRAQRAFLGFFQVFGIHVLLAGIGKMKAFLD